MRSKKSTLLRMDNIGIVVESLDEVISFVTELGLKLEGCAMIEGEWAGRGAKGNESERNWILTGNGNPIGGQHAEIDR